MDQGTGTQAPASQGQVRANELYSFFTERYSVERCDENCVRFLWNIVSSGTKNLVLTYYCVYRRIQEKKGMYIS
ncbi:hypothetical protein AYI69_g3204 [Smittium culicis]|uniref:Uncharacterized protein n=1 Tax=Smittium culicis TaxID=133412 RepID=A0A1R1YKE3_9FUNG|nr:hypothetical protein AYI69_g3204 [Smittium culicis]